MSESDVLLTFAEVAVAFAGFASLVGVLGQRKSADDPRVIGLRMRGMLLSSLMVVAFSIFPILLTRYGASPDLTWRTSSLALFAVTRLETRSRQRQISDLDVDQVRTAAAEPNVLAVAIQTIAGVTRCGCYPSCRHS